MGQPAQRGLVRPMRVIDRDQQRPPVREIDRQPVQPVQQRKRNVVRRGADPFSQQQGSNRAREARQQHVALALVSGRQTPLEQLTHHPERETSLKLRATRAQHRVTQPRCASARLLQNCCLADTRPALDDDRATLLQQPTHRRQLALAFEQALHDTTL